MTTRTPSAAVASRPLLQGLSDRLLGPGATGPEIALGLGSGAAAALALPALALHGGAVWSPWQILAAGLLAFDLVGGVVVNASAPARRFYFRAGRRRRDHLGFVAAHTLHILLVAWLFRGSDWAYAALLSAYLLGAAAVVLRAPLHLRRAVAMLGWMGAFVLSLYALAPTPGLEWFAPVLFLKLLVCYLLGDLPAQPVPGRG